MNGVNIPYNTGVNNNAGINSNNIHPVDDMNMIDQQNNMQNNSNYATASNLFQTLGSLKKNFLGGNGNISDYGAMNNIPYVNNTSSNMHFNGNTNMNGVQNNMMPMNYGMPPGTNYNNSFQASQVHPMMSGKNFQINQNNHNIPGQLNVNHSYDDLKINRRPVLNTSGIDVNPLDDRLNVNNTFNVLNHPHLSTSGIDINPFDKTPGFNTNHPIDHFGDDQQLAFVNGKMKELMDALEKQQMENNNLKQQVIENEENKKKTEELVNFELDKYTKVIQRGISILANNGKKVTKRFLQNLRIGLEAQLNKGDREKDIRITEIIFQVNDLMERYENGLLGGDMFYNSLTPLILNNEIIPVAATAMESVCNEYYNSRKSENELLNDVDKQLDDLKKINKDDINDRRGDDIESLASAEQMEKLLDRQIKKLQKKLKKEENKPYSIGEILACLTIIGAIFVVSERSNNVSRLKNELLKLSEKQDKANNKVIENFEKTQRITDEKRNDMDEVSSPLYEKRKRDITSKFNGKDFNRSALLQKFSTNVSLTNLQTMNSNKKRDVWK